MKQQLIPKQSLFVLRPWCRLLTATRRHVWRELARNSQFYSTFLPHSIINIPPAVFTQTNKLSGGRPRHCCCTALSPVKMTFVSGAVQWTVIMCQFCLVARRGRASSSLPSQKHAAAALVSPGSAVDIGYCETAAGTVDTVNTRHPAGLTSATVSCFTDPSYIYLETLRFMMNYFRLWNNRRTMHLMKISGGIFLAMFV